MIKHIIFTAICSILTFFMIFLSWFLILMSEEVDAYFVAKNARNYKTHTFTAERFSTDADGVKIYDGLAGRGWRTYSKITHIDIDSSFEKEVVEGDELTVVVLERPWQHDMCGIIVSIEKDGKQYIDSSAQRKAVEQWAKSVATEILLILAAFFGTTFICYGMTAVFIVLAIKKSRKAKSKSAEPIVTNMFAQ